MSFLAKCLFMAGCIGALQGEAQTVPEIHIPDTYHPSGKKIYHKGWIDFNKNGVKDVYEDPSTSIDARVEDLLGRMTLEEKTCQMVTLYGYGRMLKDDLPNDSWHSAL